MSARARKSLNWAVRISKLVIISLVTFLLVVTSAPVAQAITSPTSMTWSQPGPSRIAWKYSADSNGGTGSTLHFHPKSVAFGNGTFVAVSDSYNTSFAVETSLDGNNWTPQLADTSSTWTGVAFGNNIFVAVGIDENWTHGVAMTSIDGVNWNSVNLPDNQTTFTSITFDGSQFVAIGNPSNLGTNQFVMYSLDGVNWQFENSGGVDGYWSSVSSGNGKIVAVGNGGNESSDVMVSSDGGINWETKTIGESSNWFSVTYGNGLFLAVSQYKIMTSDDGGDTWNIVRNNNNDSWFVASYANGSFILIGDDGINKGLIAVSSDATNWIYQDISIARGWTGAAYDSGNNTFVVMNNNGAKIFTDLMPTVPTYVLEVASNTWPDNIPVASICDSCLIGMQVNLKRSDGAILDYGSNPSVTLTATTSDGSPTSIVGLGTQVIYWGTTNYTIQGPGDGSTIGQHITFHAQLDSDGSIQGDLSVSFVANDGAPSVNAISGQHGEFINLAPASGSSPEGYEFYLSSDDPSNISPLNCMANADVPIDIYPNSGNPYNVQFPNTTDPFINSWYQITPTYWYNHILSDQNGIPSRILISGLVSGCYYSLSVIDTRQGFESDSTTITFNYSPVAAPGQTFTIHNQSELEAVAQELIDYPGSNFELGNSFSIIDTSTRTSYISGSFIGDFNGNNYKISGLRAPLFEQIGDNLSSDVHVLHLNLSTDSNGVSAQGILTPTLNYGIVSDVHVSGKLNVVLEAPSGGLIGQTSSGTLIETSTASVSIHILPDFDIQTELNVGGLVGSAMGTISNSASSGNLFYYNPSDIPGSFVHIGGLVGLASTQGDVYVNNSQSAVDIYMDTHAPLGIIDIGGLIGRANSSFVTSSLATGILRSNQSQFSGGVSGGFIGTASNSTITNSLASETVSGYWGPVSDFIGFNDSSIIENSGPVSQADLIVSGVQQMNNPSDSWAINPSINFGNPYLTPIDPSGFYSHEPLTSYAPNISISPTTYSPTFIGDSRGVQLVVTTTESFNNGMGFQGWTIEGNNSDFRLVPGSDQCLGAEVGVGDTCTVTVAFSPTSAGIKTAVLSSVVYTALGQIYEFVTISGTGIVRTIPTVPSLTWTSHNVLANQIWQSVTSSSDGLHLAGVVNNGDIFTSSDGGSSWLDQIAAGNRYWSSISSSADGSVLFAADGGQPAYGRPSGGYIYRSTDYGTNWEALTAADSLPWSSLAISSSGEIITAANYDEHIYRSIDTGTTWEDLGSPSKTTPGGTSFYTSISTSSDGMHVSVAEDGDGDGGYLYRSDDGGATWSQQAEYKTWVSISSNSDGSRLIAAGNVQPDGYVGDIWISTDSGTSWTDRTLSLGEKPWAAVTSSADGSRLAAVTSNGFIYVSSDYGITWDTQTIPGQNAWTSITSSTSGYELAATGMNAEIWTLGRSPATTTYTTPTRYPVFSPVEVETSTTTTKPEKPTPVPTPKPTPQPNVQPTMAMKKIATFRFEVGSHLLSKDSQNGLKAIAAKINLLSQKYILIYGNSDAQPSRNNTLLSKNRALEVRKYLAKYLKGKVISVGWFGSSKPAVVGKSATAYANNRRVEIWIK